MKDKKAKRWNKREVKYLRKNYPDGNTAEIASALGRTVQGVCNKAWSLGVHKSPEYVAAAFQKFQNSPGSISNRFKPGNVPSHKGKKQWQYMSPEAIERNKRVRFKPGRRPHNAKPDGYETVNSDSYVMVKVPGCPRMVRKHIWTWEQHFGPVPEGMLVTFRDGDKTNCSIDNLVLRSRAEAMALTVKKISPEKREATILKSQAKRNELIRKDKMRIRWGLEPRTKLVKKWYAPQL